jgi:hypothetical protein
VRIELDSNAVPTEPSRRAGQEGTNTKDLGEPVLVDERPLIDALIDDDDPMSCA